MTELQRYIVSKIEKYLELLKEDEDSGYQYDVIEHVVDLIQDLHAKDEPISDEKNREVYYD